ncbi:hypothetical protein [Kitasatospora sp. NE20-6]|uniref:hypothetical protein n=1 Tax=Kitasatospora sp. NE20-6 TaxID=2859066 RepID=UPI0038B3EF58
MIRSTIRFVLALPLLAMGSAFLTVCGILPIALFADDPEADRALAESDGQWLVMLAVAPCVALFIAWCYRPDRRRRLARRRLAARAAALMAAAGFGIVRAYASGVESLWSFPVLGGVATLTTALCVIAWGVLNRGPRQGPAIAGAALVAAVAAVVRAPADPLVAVAAGSACAVAAATALVAVWRIPAVRLRVGLPPVDWTRGGVHHPQRQPVPGEIWWADVPFANGPGSKDRPVLVVRTLGDRLETLNSTSQDWLSRSDHIRLPTRSWNPDADHDSCLDLRLRTLDTDRLRRYAGPCPTGVWRVVRGRTLPLVRTAASDPRGGQGSGQGGRQGGERLGGGRDEAWTAGGAGRRTPVEQVPRPVGDGSGRPAADRPEPPVERIPTRAPGGKPWGRRRS